MSWIETTVGEFCPFIYGKSLPKTKRIEGEIPVYGSNGCVGLHSDSCVAGPGIIIGRKGSVGAVHLSTVPFWPIDTSFYIEKESLDELKFIYYILKSLGLENMNSDSAVPGLNRENAHALPIKIPKTKEDREKIGRWISIYDNKIELNRQTNQTLENIAQAIFKSWFVDFEPTRAKIAAKQNGQDPERAAMAAISGKTLAELGQLSSEQQEQLKTTAALFPDTLTDSELGEIPEGWELGELKNIAKFSTDRISTLELSLENYISTENMLQDKEGISIASSLPTVKTVPIFNLGQILISNIRPYFMKIWLARFEGGRSNDVLGIEEKEPESVEYLYNLLYQDVFFNFMMTTSKGAKMPRGDKEAIMGWVCVQPSIEIKKTYSTRIENFYKIIDSVSKENKWLESMRDMLLPKLLSGEININS